MIRVNTRLHMGCNEKSTQYYKKWKVVHFIEDLKIEKIAYFSFFDCALLFLSSCRPPDTCRDELLGLVDLVDVAGVVIISRYVRCPWVRRTILVAQLHNDLPEKIPQAHHGLLGVGGSLLQQVEVSFVWRMSLIKGNNLISLIKDYQRRASLGRVVPHGYEGGWPIMPKQIRCKSDTIFIKLS